MGITRAPMVFVVYIVLVGTGLAGGQEADSVKQAQAYRKGGQPVRPVSDTTLLCEAEEFQVKRPGWQAKAWGTNYYAATFANCFLSRKAYLGSPDQCERTVATIDVQVPRAGRYLALVRYEAVYRFETQFRLLVEQNGTTLLDRLYGARDNVKIWAFGKKLQKEVAWDWGAVENVVWEGHDTYVNLQAGKATLSLIADKQPGNAARRNVDLVMLTTDEAQVRMRIDKEGYLPLDGMLTQAGDVYLKLHNDKKSTALTLTVPNGTEHSSYWVHLRTWQPTTLSAASGESTDWVEVGSLLDSLNDGQWLLTAKGAGAVRFHLEFGVRNVDGKIESIKKLENLTGDVALAYNADTRYSRRVSTTEEVLYNLVEYLKKQPVHGQRPKRTLVYGYTFDPRPDNARYTAARAEFIHLVGATALVSPVDSAKPLPESPVEEPAVRHYLSTWLPPGMLEEYCRKLKAEGKADKIAVVSLGDEIGLAVPPANDHAGFRAWLKGQQLPADVQGADAWEYNPDPRAAGNPARYYYSRRYAHYYGIQSLKQRTDILGKYLPNAGVGANYSPHGQHAYLGDVAQWVTTFREGAMTQPWGEDYIWQLPVGTQQMNFINLDMFRAGLRGQPERKIHYYVMPHWPGNTPDSWRRQFYGDLAHGMKVIDLFEFRPVQSAYTENHVSRPEMFQEVRRSLHELGQFEDIVQDGQMRPGTAGLWFSETGDIWDDNRHPFDAGKRALYIAVRHQQLALDVVVEADALAGTLKDYRVLYLTDAHVSRAASKAIADWVAAGGRLLATAGAGLFDELNRPNTVLGELLGVQAAALETPADASVRFIKQDLPFSQPLDAVTWQGSEGAVELPVLAARAPFKLNGAEVRGKFKDGSPAIAVKTTGKGETTYCGFLPGLAYFKPAIPLRPVDRGSTDDSMAHFIPSDFHAGAGTLVGFPAAGVARPVICSQSLVESTVIESKHGVLIPLVNWSGSPVKGLTVTVTIDVPNKTITSATGRPVQVSDKEGKRMYTLDLDIADALILR